MSRPKKEKKSFHLRIDPAVIDKTAKKAKEEGFDTSTYIEQLCRKDNAESNQN